MIVAITCVGNEVDIIDTTFRHMFDQGIDRIYLLLGMVTDGTGDHVASYGDKVRIFSEAESYFRQAFWMNLLAMEAADDGADWIVPFDIDEFIYATGGGTITDALMKCEEGIRKLYLRVWRHVTWDYREIEPELPMKCVFRPTEGAVLTMGSHDVSECGPGYLDILDLREWKYRSFEHFCRKIREQLRTLDPTLGKQFATHVRQYEGFTDEQMAAAWSELVSVPVVYDPIPARQL